MATKRYILSIDQGTSGTKTLIIDEAGKVSAKASEPLKTSYLNSGFVEQDPEEIFQNVLSSVKKCIEVFVNNGEKVITALIYPGENATQFSVFAKDGNVKINALKVWDLNDH